MANNKLRFEIRQADDGTYHVVQVFGAGATLVIHQTLHSTLEDAELWLKAIEEVINMTNKSTR